MSAYTSFGAEYNGVYYSFISILGLTISKKNHKTPNKYHKKKIAREMDAVEDPYKANIIDESYLQHNPKISRFVKIYVSAIIWLYHHFYPGLWLISHIRLNIYRNAIEACDVFHKIHPKGQNVLCLPRSIFAATTSKRFSKNGIMIIGGFLPSHHMHAWIMEEGRNAYRWDQIWINYTPICAMS